MRIAIKVKANAGQQSVTELPDGSLFVQLKSPPVDGKANQELVKLLARYDGVSRADVAIQQGARSRYKTVEITGEA